MFKLFKKRNKEEAAPASDSGGLNVVQPQAAPSPPPAPVQIGGESQPVGISPSPAPASSGAPSSDDGAELTLENLERVLDERIRPGLMADGGNIELVDIQDGKVMVKLVGACGGCPSAAQTMQFGVERILKEAFPGITGLVNIGI